MQTWSDARISCGLVGLSTITRLEIGDSARNGEAGRRHCARPPLSLVPVEHLTPAIEDRVPEVQLCEELTDRLQRLKDTIGPDLAVDTGRLNEVAADLVRLGRRVSFALSGANERTVHGVQRFWRDATSASLRAGRIPIVECIGDEASLLPVEYLPLFGFDDPVGTSSPGQLAEVCGNVVGFACAVRRQILEAPVPSTAHTVLKRDSTGRVPVRFLHFDSLPGAQAEYDWFTVDAAHDVTVEGPYPAGGQPLNVAEQVFDPHSLILGGRRAVPDQIQHFACHCYAGTRRPLDYEIELSGGGAVHRVTLGDLGDSLVKLAATNAARTYDLPLVVLNACGSSTVAPDGALSFPLLFLQNGNRGFIGTDIAVPDDLAAAFSKAFYSRLIKHEQPLWQAVVRARRDLVHRFANPLGIVYAVYAEPELTVAS